MKGAETDRLLGELTALRQEIASLREEQQRLSDRVDEMTRAFRAIATQIGIASEPYRRSAASAESGSRDLPGFA